MLFVLQIKKESEPIYWKLEYIPVIKPDKIESQALDIILIPSKKSEEDIKQKLKVGEFYGTVIGLHTWLKEQGIDIAEEFYLYHSLGKYKLINHEYIKFV